MTVAPEVFSAKMEQHWTENLGNVSNEALKQTWEQIAKTLNEHISNHTKHELATKWSVLQPPTGSGKTQSLILYCSMLADLPKKEHPGVLIVTKRIQECDGIVNQINELIKIETAISFHSEAKIKPNELKDYPVVVITHKAYENALDYLGDTGSIRQTWPYFHEWGQGTTRRLVIIDECLDIVESSQAGLEGLRQTLAAIPEKTQLNHPNEVKIIEGVIQALEHTSILSKEEETPVQETMVTHDDKYLEHIHSSLTLSEESTDISALIHAIKDKSIRFDHQTGRNDLTESNRLRQRHTKRLKDLQHILKSWRYYSGVKNGGALHTARLIIPEETKGAVVFDATASTNVIYELHKDSAIIPTPAGTRNYQNVTLHVSKGHKLGKVYMGQHAKKLCGELVSELNPVLKGKNALVVCHKDVEPVLNKYDTTFDMKTGHWGAIDGSNEWRDCDTAVIFGLPYLPDHWTANCYMALQGCTSTGWLQNANERAFGLHNDIRQALKHGKIITDVIQGINRIRCRRVVDAGGNCEETHIYLLLPNSSLADELINAIEHQMSNIKITDWNYTGQRKKPRASKHEASLMKYIQNMEPECKVAVNHVGKTLGISPSTMKRLKTKAKTSESALALVLNDSGVILENERRGRTKKSYLWKH